jgi:hypothetical protein
MFLREFQTMLERLVLLLGELVILGDFNFHVDNPTKSDAVQFMSLLEAFDLTQHVDLPTHIDGHALDLLITRASSVDLISGVCVTEPFISDHLVVHFTLNISKPGFPQTFHYRPWRSVVMSDFILDIANSSLLSTDTDSVSDLDQTYSRVLSDIGNIHAPLVYCRD